MSGMDFDLLVGATELPAKSFQTGVCQKCQSESAVVNAASTPVNTSILHRWLCQHVVDKNFEAAHTVVLFTDTRRLSTYDFFSRSTADLWSQRLRWKRFEQFHAVFVPISDDNGLTSCHMTHAAVHVLRSLRSRFPGKHFISADADVGPTALSEVWQWISIAQECERLRVPRSDDDPQRREAALPGIILCNDKGARANAGLVISPGVGRFDRDLARTSEEWCRLLEQRMEVLRRRRSSFASTDASNTPYGLHMAALASYTKLWGVTVEEPQDYLHIWAVICNVLSVAAWPKSRCPNTHPDLGGFSDVFRLASPKIDGWAGPFYEQPALSFLEAFATCKCYISIFSSELGFMKQYASRDTGNLSNLLQPAVMPCLFLHAYGVHAKTKLVTFRLGFWVNMSQSFQGALSWQPCFMDGTPGSIIRVEASCGFQVEMLISNVARRMVDEDGWRKTHLSCNQLFLQELSPLTINAEAWPLWSNVVREQCVNKHEYSNSARHDASGIRIACPGLQSEVLEEGRSGSHLFEHVPHVCFTNAGRRGYYGPTREKADHIDGSRSDDAYMNALHYLLLDRGCDHAWNVVLPGWEVVTLSMDVPCCPSWLAEPCSSSVFAVLASVSQFTPHCDSYLRFLGLANDPVPSADSENIEFLIRGDLNCFPYGFSFVPYALVILCHLC